MVGCSDPKIVFLLCIQRSIPNQIHIDKIILTHEFMDKDLHNVNSAK